MAKQPKIQKFRKDGGLTSAQRDDLRLLVEDLYVTNRWHIIRTNFLRGLAFGFGTFIGGTIIVALVIWFLSQTVDVFPWARDFVQRIIDSLQK